MKMLSVKDVSVLLHISTQQVYALVKKGALPHGVREKDKGRIYFEQEPFMRWVDHADPEEPPVEGQPSSEAEHKRLLMMACQERKFTRDRNRRKAAKAQRAKAK